MNKDELQSKISDLVTDVTIDPSGESIVATVKEIMKLVDEYEHVEPMKLSKFLFSFKTVTNGVENRYFKKIYATGKTREEAEWEAKVEVYKRSRVWPDEIILLECKEVQ